MAQVQDVGVRAVIQNYNEFVTGMSQMGKSFGGFVDEASRASGRVSSFGQSLSDASDKIVSVGKTITASITIPLLSLGAIALNSALDYESAFAGVAKTNEGIVKSAEQLATDLRNALPNITEAELSQRIQFLPFSQRLTDEGKRLEEAFRTLSLEIPLPATELAHIAEIGGQLGIANESLVGFTETIAGLGVSTELGTEQAALALGKLATVFGIPADAADDFALRVGGAIVALGNNLATTETPITNFATRVAGTFSALQIPVEYLLAMGAAVTATGTQVEAGGSSIQTALLTLSGVLSGSSQGFIDNSAALEAAGDEAEVLSLRIEAAQSRVREATTESARLNAQASLLSYTQDLEAVNAEIEALTDTNGLPATNKELGILAQLTGLTADELKDMWQNGISPTGEQLEIGAARGEVFIKFIEGLAAEGENAAVVLDELGIGGIRSVKTFLGLSGGAEQLGLALSLASEQMQLTDAQLESQNALLIEAGIRYSTTASQIQLLKNTFTNLAIVIGSQLLPIIVPIAQKIASVITDLVKKFEGLEPARKAAIVLGAALLAALGPAITLIGTLAGAIGGLLPLFSGLGFVGNGIVAGLGLLVGQSVQLNGGVLPTLIGFVQELYDWLTAKMPAGGITEVLFNLLKDTPSEISITPTISTHYLSDIQQTLATLQTYFTPIANNIQLLFQTIFNGIYVYLATVMARIQGLPLLGYLSQIIQSFNNLVVAFGGAVSNVFSTLYGGLGSQIVNSIVSILGQLIAAIAGYVTRGLDALAGNMDYFASVLEVLLAIGNVALASFSDNLGGAFSEIGRVISETSGATSSFFLGLYDNFLRLTAILTGNLGENNIQIGDTITVVISSLADAVIILVNTILPALLTKITAFVDYIATEGPRLAEGLRQFFSSDFLSYVQTFATFIATHLDEIAKAIGLLLTAIFALERVRDVGLFLRPFNSVIYNIELTLHSLGQVAGYASGAMSLLAAPLGLITSAASLAGQAYRGLAFAMWDWRSEIGDVASSVTAVSQPLVIAAGDAFALRDALLLAGSAGETVAQSMTNLVDGSSESADQLQAISEAIENNPLFHSDFDMASQLSIAGDLFDLSEIRDALKDVPGPSGNTDLFTNSIEASVAAMESYNQSVSDLFLKDKQLTTLFTRRDAAWKSAADAILKAETAIATVQQTLGRDTETYSAKIRGLQDALADLLSIKNERVAKGLPIERINSQINATKKEIARLEKILGSLGPTSDQAINKLQQAIVDHNNKLQEQLAKIDTDVYKRVDTLVNRHSEVFGDAAIQNFERLKDEAAAISEVMQRETLSFDEAVNAIPDLDNILKSPIAADITGEVVGEVVESKSVFSRFSTYVSGLVAGLVTHIKAIPSTIGGFFTYIGTSFSSVFGSIFSGITGTISSVASAIFGLLNPVTIAIGAILGAVLALGAAASGLDFTNVFGTLFSGDFAEFFAQISEGLGNLGTSIKTGFGAIVVFIQPLLQAFRELGASFGSLSQLGGPLGDLFNKLGEIGEILGPRLLVVAGILGGVLITALTAVVSAIAGMLPGIIQVIGGLTDIVTGVLSLFGGLAEVILGVFTYIFTGSSEQIKRGGKLLGDGLKHIFGGILDVLLGSLSAVFGGITGFVEGIALSIGAFASTLGNSEAGQWFLNLATTAQQAVFLIQYFFQWLSDVLVGHSIIPDMIMAIAEWFTLSSVIATITQVIPQIVTQFLLLGLNALVAVQQFIANMTQAGYDLVMGIVQGVIAGGANLVLSLIKVLGETVEAGKDFLLSHSPSQLAAAELGIPISEGIAEGIDTYGYLIGDSLINVTGQGFASAYDFGTQTAQQFGARLASAIGQSMITGSRFNFGSAQDISELIPQRALDGLSEFNQAVLNTAINAGVSADEFIALGLQAGISVEQIKEALSQAALDQKMADLQAAVADGRLTFEQAQTQYEQFADSLSTGIGLTIEVDQANYLAARATFEQLKAEGVEVVIRPVLGATTDLRELLPAEGILDPSAVVGPVETAAEQLNTAATNIVLAGVANTLEIANAGVAASAAIEQAFQEQLASGREGGLLGGGADLLTQSPDLANIDRLQQEYAAIDDTPLTPMFDMSGLEAFNTDTMAIFNAMPTNAQPAFDQISTNFGVELTEMTTATTTWATGLSSTIATSFNVGGFTLAMGLMRQTAQVKLAEILTLFSSTLTSMSLAVALSSITIQQAFGVLLGAVANKIKGSEVPAAWSGIGVEIAAGVVSWTSLILTAIDSLLTQSITKLSNAYQQFYDTGAYLMTGLADGIASMAAAVAAAAAAAAQGAVEAAQDVTQTQSPSRVMYELGQNMDRGLVEGLQDGSQEVVDTSAETLNQVIDQSADLLDSYSFTARSLPVDIVYESRSYETVTSGLHASWTAMTEDIADESEDIASEIGTNMATAITESIDTVWSTWLEGRPLDGIFDLANTISSAGSAFADLFTEQVLDPIQAQIDELADSGQESLSDLLETIGLTEEELQAQVENGGTVVLEPRFDVVEDQLGRFLEGWGIAEDDLQTIFDEITGNFTLEEMIEDTEGIADSMAGEFGLASQEFLSIINSIIDSASLTEDENTLLAEYLAAQAERNALEQEYLEQQERILALQEQQQQLDFLKQQFDLIKALTEAGLDPADILDGITLGLDASVPDLIEAMTVALQALIQAANDELEIGSPSKVFATIGGQMMAGINTGVLAATSSTVGYMENAMHSIASTQYPHPAVAGNYQQSTSVDKSVTINVDAHYAKQQLPGHIGADIAALMYNVVW